MKLALINPKFMPDLGPESWQTTEKSESYATEQGNPLDGVESRRTTEKPAK